MSLLPHQERVVTERDELSDKVVKLGSFLKGTIFPTIDTEEQGRLCEQYFHMKVYLDVLDKRIAAF